MDGDLFPGNLVRIDTDRLSRSETQIRAQADPHLIAEYAQAMLRGAEFPPVVVFDDGEFLHLGDGYHRADAVALAHAKNPTRPNTVLADVRKGTLEDALRYAMSANHAHGKRFGEDDYRRAIQVALRHRLIEVERASEVVPGLMALIPGLSGRYARKCTSDLRAQLVAKRDRVIVALHRDGKTQQEIADQLDIDQKTVSRIIERIRQNGPSAETPKPAPPPSPPEDPKPEAEAAKPAPKAKPAAKDSAPAIQMDFTPLLPLLDDDQEDDDETGIVAGISEPPVPDDPLALGSLRHIDQSLTNLFDALKDLTALEGKISLPAVQPVHSRLLGASKFLTELAAYIHQRGLQNAP